jgi:hypothetical protein
MSTSAPKAKRLNAHGALVGFSICAILLVTYAITAYEASTTKCATYDEPLHFVGAWIETHTHDFRIDPENPPLWKYYAVAGTRASDLQLENTGDLWHSLLSDLGLNNPYAKHVLYEIPANSDSDDLMQSARARMVFLATLLGAIIALWSWRLAGPLAACVACAAYCLDPNFLAHGPLIKNDVPTALLFVTFMFAIWLLGRRAGVWQILAVAALLAALVTTKFSGLLAIPILALSLIVRAAIPADWPVLHSVAKTFRRRLLPATRIFFIALFFSYVAIWACYDFRFAPAPDSKELSTLDQPTDIYSSYQSMAEHGATVDTPRSQALEWIAQWQPGPVVRVTQWLHTHHLFPETYLRGFLYIAGDTQLRQTFLLGRLRLTGWWYYFPLVILFKTPLATLLAILLATIFWLTSRPNWKSWSLFAGAITPTLYFLSALRSNTDLGMRHILPIYPFLFIFVGVIAARTAARYSNKIIVPILAVLFLTLAAETFSAYPDYIPFFNIAAGGSRGGLHLLADSNLDWGQDLKLLAAWRKEHPEGQLALCYFGSADPRYYGLHYVNLPASDAPDDEPVRNVPHVYAFSATLLQGLYMDSDQREDYAQFNNYKIAAVLGGSIYVYNQP